MVKIYSITHQTVKHHDKVSFIPEMTEHFNIHKLTNVIYNINRLKEKHVIISLDIENSFEIEYSFRIKVLENLEIQGTCSNILKEITANRF